MNPEHISHIIARVMAPLIINGGKWRAICYRRINGEVKWSIVLEDCHEKIDLLVSGPRLAAK